MVTNPWHELPTRPPYVLPDDQPHVDEFNQRLRPNHKHFLQLDRILPEPFMGRRDAPVILLSNNPGLGLPNPGKAVTPRECSDFAAKMRKNLLHEVTDFPFLPLDPAFPRGWWHSKLKALIEHFDEPVVAMNVLNVAEIL